jgi:hypothetical protein
MSDLRTRIAYAIAQADGDEPGMEPASCDYEMADAVIRELGLKKENVGTIHRYITDWKDS